MHASKDSQREKPSDALYREMYAAEKKHKNMFVVSVALEDTVRHRKRNTIKPAAVIFLILCTPVVQTLNNLIATRVSNECPEFCCLQGSKSSMICAGRLRIDTSENQ